MNDEVLIKVENVSKKFCRSLKRSMFYGVADISRDVLNLDTSSYSLRQEEFWAVESVSFEVKRGECLGIIGRNGAGKSTLLKMLNGLYPPDKGKITVKGDVGALIEVGAGFHPMLSGRENIFINGSLLGMSKEEIDLKFDEILAFAEVEAFVDMPVKHYSSGMIVRLGFAIAAQLEPDVLILDEVLAVGDISFQAKCFNVIQKMAKKSAVIFISHQMSQISRVCTNIAVLKQGKCSYLGDDVAKGIEVYNKQNVVSQKSAVSGSGKAVVHGVSLIVEGQVVENNILYGGDWSIQTDVTIDASEKSPSMGFSLISQDLKIAAQCVSHFNQFKIENKGQRMKILLDLGRCNLNPGIYWLRIGVQGDKFGEILIRYENYMKIIVQGDVTGASSIQYLGNWKVLSCDDI